MRQQVCLDACTLFATTRKNPGATGNSLGPSPGDYLFSAAFGKRAKAAASEAKAGGPETGSEAKSKAMVTARETEVLTKEGKADIQGLRGVVLRIAESVPGTAWRGGQWRRVSYPSWRTFVRSATGPRELMQVKQEKGVYFVLSIDFCLLVWFGLVLSLFLIAGFHIRV